MYIVPLHVAIIVQDASLKSEMSHTQPLTDHLAWRRRTLNPS